MQSLNTLNDLLSYARNLAEPLAATTYVPDWERRAAILSAISDYLIIRLRDDAFVHEQLSTRSIECDADVGYRALLARGLRAILAGEQLTFPAAPLAIGKDAQILTELCSTLDYSEKVVISATAYAILKLSLSTELLSVVANILFEEAYHLKIISDMLGIDQSSRPWLPPDKTVNWALVTECGDEYTYMLLEHVLFEARGAIAAAKGVHEAQVRGLSPQSGAWLVRICSQETNHGVSGLEWFHRDGRSADLSPSARLIVRRFIEQECDDTTGTFRTLRQRYSSWLLAKYFSGASIQEVTACLKDDVVRCQHTGDITPTLEDVSRATDLLYENVSREGGRQ